MQIEHDDPSELLVGRLYNKLADIKCILIELSYKNNVNRWWLGNVHAAYENLDELSRNDWKGDEKHEHT